MDNSFSIDGQIVDIFQRRIFPGRIEIAGDKIVGIFEMNTDETTYILPGFIDAHIHIESSMVVPYEFAKIALSHGTVATVSDPHEIANVLGMEGVKYMIDNARDAHLKFCFGAPSCVPATDFETAGARLGLKEIEELIHLRDIGYLSEMMNYPGVLTRDELVMGKIALAKKVGKPIDGHAPGLVGEEARRYIEAGISTDHECFTLDEALQKLSFGMKIIIREGSAAKNFEALHPLIAQHSDSLMFCSDDKHPDDLVEGHINSLVSRAISLDYDLFDVLKIACINPIDHYQLDVGRLRVGDKADLVVVNDLSSLKVDRTMINGLWVFNNGSTVLQNKSHQVINNFNIQEKNVRDFAVRHPGGTFPVIVALDGEIVTEREDIIPKVIDGELYSDVERDLLKICVVNRYHDAPVSVGLITNFGLGKGALASTVGHDCHNIVAVGVDDQSICDAVNLLVESGGGLSAVGGKEPAQVSLPIAGLMSDLPCEVVADQYAFIDRYVKELGCQLGAPFMTLSFMALLVIPKIKISDKGIFDAEKFEFLRRL